MKINKLKPQKLGSFRYAKACGRKDAQGKLQVLQGDLPILHIEAEGLPANLHALVLTSDLQGLTHENEGAKLLGEALPEFLALLLPLELQLDPAKTGVVLAGDFFATLESRGGLDDVRPVWRCFRDHFRWVAGVSGNHDDIGKSMDAVPVFKKENGIHYLENEEVTLDSVRVGGLSGVIGENGKHNRIAESDFLKMLKNRLDRRPDLLVTHQNPFHESTPQKGGQGVLEALLRAPGQLLVCGHAIWEEPFFEMKNGAQVLNVGERVVVLTAAR